MQSETGLKDPSDPTPSAPSSGTTAASPMAADLPPSLDVSGSGEGVATGGRDAGATASQGGPAPDSAPAPAPALAAGVRSLRAPAGHPSSASLLRRALESNFSVTCDDDVAAAKPSRYAIEGDETSGFLFPADADSDPELHALVRQFAKDRVQGSLGGSNGGHSYDSPPNSGTHKVQDL